MNTLNPNMGNIHHANIVKAKTEAAVTSHANQLTSKDMTRDVDKEKDSLALESDQVLLTPQEEENADPNKNIENAQQIGLTEAFGDEDEREIKKAKKRSGGKGDLDQGAVDSEELEEQRTVTPQGKAVSHEETIAEIGDTLRVAADIEETRAQHMAQVMDRGAGTPHEVDPESLVAARKIVEDKLESNQSELTGLKQVDITRVEAMAPIETTIAGISEDGRPLPADLIEPVSAN
ncbi:MAG: hypothetical protein HYU64_17405 [Armatimonadetes bacterium]|nr:hypothetical protein [Armatimonadota bacterium]